MADNQITPFQLTDQFTMDNFNQRINETNTALQKKADLGEDGKVPAEQMDAYSQSDSLSAETRTALGLAETATPDAALAEIARQLSESGGVQMDLLWENASRTSDFAEQTINLSISQNSFVCIVFCESTSQTENLFYKFAKVGESTKFFMPNSIGSSTSPIYIGYRRLSITETGVFFETAYKKATNVSGAGSSDNSKIIPVAIYEIGGVKIV